jgi:hypothetical protein
LERHLAGPHLPQGSPTAPALANLAAHGLDRRLAALADGSGLRYSRYADDLALSAPGRRGPARCASLVRLVTRIATEEGFRINEAKSTVRTAGQHQRLAGIVVNDHPNLDRREFDRLKATLTNTARLGPDSQNRIGHANFRDHLTGRVAWVEHLNPGRGRRSGSCSRPSNGPGPVEAGRSVGPRGARRRHRPPTPTDSHKEHHTMEYRTLGRSGLRVSTIVLGTMTFGGHGKFRDVGATQVDEAASMVKTTEWSEPPVHDWDRTYDIIDAVVEVADGRGVSRAQVALAWLLGRP